MTHLRLQHDRASRLALAFCLVAAALVLASPAGAITVTLQPSVGDSQLSQGAATTNFGSATTIQVASQSGSQNKRILVKFDLSSMPANATSIPPTSRCS